MTQEQALSLQPGDHVTHPNWRDTEGNPVMAVVGEVSAQLFPGDPVILFRDGGWWRSSRLQQVFKQAGGEPSG